MIAGPFGGAMPVPFWRNAYVPVRNEKRVGVHVDAEQYPLVKRTPSLASWSMAGVSMLCGAVARDVAVPEIIGHDDDDVRLLSGEVLYVARMKTPTRNSHGTKSNECAAMHRVWSQE